MPRKKKNNHNTRVMIDGKEYKSIRDAAETVFGKIFGKRKPGERGVSYYASVTIREGKKFGRIRPRRVKLKRLYRWCLADGLKLHVLRRGSVFMPV